MKSEWKRNWIRCGFGFLSRVLWESIEYPATPSCNARKGERQRKDWNNPKEGYAKGFSGFTAALFVFYVPHYFHFYLYSWTFIHLSYSFAVTFICMSPQCFEIWGTKIKYLGYIIVCNMNIWIFTDDFSEIFHKAIHENIQIKNDRPSWNIWAFVVYVLIFFVLFEFAFTFTLQISLNTANRIKESHNTSTLLFKAKYAQRQNSRQWKGDAVDNTEAGGIHDPRRPGNHGSLEYWKKNNMT